MCAHRHFNHKSTVWGLENLRKGDWQKGIKSTQRSKALEALLSGWERATQTPSISPLWEMTPAATTINGVDHGFPATLGGVTIQAVARHPRSSRLGNPARRRRLGEAGSPELGVEGGCTGKGWGGGRGLCCLFKSRVLPPPRRRPESHKRTGCC